MRAKGRRFTILLADDDADDRLMVKEAFQEARLLNDLRFVTDGEELLAYLQRRGPYRDRKKSPCPGFILLDLNMPKKDGREALREIKADTKLRHIPVVVLTTSDAHADIVACYADGAASYIHKPVTFDNMVKVVKALGQYWFDIVTLPPIKE